MEILNDGEKGNGRRRRKRAGGRRKESDKDRGSEKEELGMEGGGYHSAPSPSLLPGGCCIYAPSLPMCPRSTQILLHQLRSQQYLYTSILCISQERKQVLLVTTPNS